MREHLGLLPVLPSSEIIGGQSSAGSGPFQAMPSGQRSRRHRRPARLCCGHCRACLRRRSPLKSGINYTAALGLRRLGVLQGAGIFTLRKWACQNLRLRLVDVFCIAGSCRWVPRWFGGGRVVDVVQVRKRGCLAKVTLICRLQCCGIT